MRILAVETSCDETSAAVLEKNNNSIRCLSNVISSSADLHALTGGIIPEQAAREQVKLIIPVILKALKDAGISDEIRFETAGKAIHSSIDAIAVTYGPGLIGSLLIGVETTKTLSLIFKKPIIPVSHLLAHLYANFIREDITEITFPAVGLIVSGGHTDLLIFESLTTYKWIGGTRDDAAGEAFDKIGRILGLPYPAGPQMEKQAQEAVNKNIKFSKALINSNDYDFSFSGLKAEAARFVQKHEKLSNTEINEICYSVQESITEVLVAKTLKAAEEYNAKSILLGGGVSANSYLRTKLQLNAKLFSLDAKLFFPEMQYCTDNAAMIGATALILNNPVPWHDIKAKPELYFA